jgi:elongation factor 3
MYDSDAKAASVETLLDTLKSTTGEKFEMCLADLCVIVTKMGVTSTEGASILSFMTADIQNISSTKEGAVAGLSLSRDLLNVLKSAMDPFMLPLLTRLTELHADKAQTIRDLSATVLALFMQCVNPYAFRLVLPVFVKSWKHDDWRCKVAGLVGLKELSPRVSEQITPFLPALIPAISECVIDTKPQVKNAGVDTLLDACKMITNDDIRSAVPLLVSVVARPEEATKVIDVLMETTFVQNVDGPTLALIAPMLGKILRGRSSALKRKAARVIDSMCRLVTEPACVAPFVPMLLPYLNRAVDEVPDAEVVEVCKEARAVLLKAMGEAASLDTMKRSESETNFTDVSFVEPPSTVGLDAQTVQVALRSSLTEAISSMNSAKKAATNATAGAVSDYIASVASQLLCFNTIPNMQAKPEDEVWRSAVAMANPSDWKRCIDTHVGTLFPRQEGDEQSNGEVKEGCSAEESEEAAHLAAIDDLTKAFRTASLGPVEDLQATENSEDTNLTNIEFSLAFGGKILLHNTHLKLGKGRRYGVMGKNGAGKTTLLTNIGTGNIEGFPAHLKMVYVQHEDRREDHGVPMIDEMMAGEDMITAGVSRELAIETLESVKFTADMMQLPRTSLSGGWKMKLLIVRAMLARADILLLDEPTNHLDSGSVKWLENYLMDAAKERGLTCLIVSHDIPFLDNVITDVIHYEQKKLVYYHGNMTHFVAIHPEARFYYELESSTLQFKFPTPEKLDGINSTTKSILTCKNVTFTYPGNEKPTLIDVSCKVTLGSRVAVLGPNGAGKSTLIKLLVQETEPDLGMGEIWKHRNLRIAYVAQHSFHHVEEHMESSPVDYMKWRFGGGVDREALDKPTMKVTEDEEAEIIAERKYGDVVEIKSRRKNGKYLEYEYTFHGQSHRDPNKHATLEQMIEWGHKKLIEQEDTKVAARAAGLDMRPILIAEIQGHLDDFNLESEFGTHGKIKRLSGGQKVKLVLAAAMWNRPHLLVMDEPTNYLDREALGALTTAIKGFGGGVLIISHNKEFTDTLCEQTWQVGAGRCTVTGEEEKESKIKAHDSKNKIRKSKSAGNMAEESEHKGAGCTNATVEAKELIMNPKKLEPLTPKETKKLSKAAAVAGVSLKDYAASLDKTSIEWKWL